MYYLIEWITQICFLILTFGLALGFTGIPLIAIYGIIFQKDKKMIGDIIQEGISNPFTLMKSPIILQAALALWYLLFMNLFIK